MDNYVAIAVAVIGVLALLAALFSTGRPARVAFMLLCWLVVVLGAGWFFNR